MTTTHPLSRVAAWRYVDEHGDAMPGAYDRTALLADLAAHASQRLVAALDAVLEQPPGSDRLRQTITVWLDLARATPRVRAFLEREATGRARAQLEQQRRLVVGLLTEDLAALDVPDAARSAVDLVREAHAVAALEDVAGRPLRRERAALLSGRVAVPEPRPSLLRRLHLVPA